MKSWISEKENREWKARLLNQLRLYRVLKPALCWEDYLLEISNRNERRELTKLRSGTHALRLETGRWRKEKIEDRLCCVCVEGEVEDEMHFFTRLLPLRQFPQAIIPENP